MLGARCNSSSEDDQTELGHALEVIPRQAWQVDEANISQVEAACAKEAHQIHSLLGLLEVGCRLALFAERS